MKKVSTRDKILDATFLLVYKYGYTGTSTSMVLETCKIPKGSLYHHFSSKKELVLAVLQERIAPKMQQFFAFKNTQTLHGIAALIQGIEKIASNDYLISYGCPLNRLNQEMSNLDEEFEAQINSIYEELKADIIVLLQESSVCDKDSLAEYIINSVWGALSLSAKQASKERFLKNISYLTSYLESFKN